MKAQLVGTAGVSAAKENEPKWKTLLARARKAMAGGREIKIHPSEATPMPNQPRVYFSPDGIARLADGIKAVGQIYAGIGRKSKNPKGKVKYEIMDGERRWRSINLAGIDVYKMTLVEADDDVASFIIAAVANFNRESHTAMEVSNSIARMRSEEYDVPMEEIAKVLGIHVIWAYKMHGLQNLHPTVRDMLDPSLPREKLLPVTAAIEISKADQSLQIALAKRLLSRALTIKSLRGEAIRMSKASGTYIRERKPEARQVWRSLDLLSKRILRTGQDVERMLKDKGTMAAIEGRTTKEVRRLAAELEQASRVMANCNRLVAKILVT